MGAVPAAKVVIAEAASRVSALAHAVHGAMGITQDDELHLFTKRLLRWRVLGGSESYWSQRVGRQLLGVDTATWVHVREAQSSASVAKMRDRT